MSENVVGLRGAMVPGAPDPGIVRALEALLVQAREGVINGLAFAVTMPDGRAATGFRCADDLRLLGAVTYLSHRLAGPVGT